MASNNDHLQHLNHPEEFILDGYFTGLVKKAYRNESLEEWKGLLKKYPAKRELMEKAYFLVNAIHIKEVEMPESCIRDSWTQLQTMIGKRKRRLSLYRWSAAASLLLFVVSTALLMLNPFTPSRMSPASVLSILDSIRSESSDIEIIFPDKNKLIVEEDAHVRQDEDGSVVVNGEKKTQRQDAAGDLIHLIVPNGKRSSLTLSDGTKVWINSGSKLIYPSRFDEKERRIYVDGEVYLEVAHNKEKPFVVQSKELAVRVLGTKFNMTTYSGDSFTDVVLVSGGVEVVTAGSKKTVQMTPNECYHVENGKRILKRVNVSNYTSWKDGFLILDSTPLSEIFVRLSRYYDVKIEFGSNYSQLRYKGKLSLDDSIEKVLHRISLTESLEYTMQGNLIQIKN